MGASTLWAYGKLASQSGILGGNHACDRSAAVVTGLDGGLAEATGLPLDASRLAGAVGEGIGALHAY